MESVVLEYKHTRNLFGKDGDFKKWVRNWFERPNYLGSKCGNWEALIEVSNWSDVKDKLPKSYLPQTVYKSKEEAII